MFQFILFFNSRSFLLPEFCGLLAGFISSFRSSQAERRIVIFFRLSKKFKSLLQRNRLVKDNEVVANEVGANNKFYFLDVPRFSVSYLGALAPQILIIMHLDHEGIELQFPINQSNKTSLLRRHLLGRSVLEVGEPITDVLLRNYLHHDGIQFCLRTQL